MSATLLAYAVIGRDGAELIFPFDPGLIAAIKATIPARARSWNPRTRRWTVHAPHIEPAIHLVGQYFEVERVSAIGAAGTAHNDRDCLRRVTARWPDHATLGLLPGASAEQIRASYRILSRERHPDAGGTHEAMVRLNAAYEKLSS